MIIYKILDFTVTAFHFRLYCFIFKNSPFDTLFRKDKILVMVVAHTKTVTHTIIMSIIDIDTCDLLDKEPIHTFVKSRRRAFQFEKHLYVSKHFIMNHDLKLFKSRIGWCPRTGFMGNG